MRLVLARCSVDYLGRLAAHLPSAMRLIMIKADGSVSVHADAAAYKPLNWMSPPCTLRQDGDLWTVTNPAGEQLLIRMDEVVSDVEHSLGIDPGLVKDGVEAHLQELLAARCAVLGAGWTLVRREWMTDIGPVDLLCRDAAGLPVAVEIKRRGEIAGVEQLVRYVERLGRDPLLPGIRGVLAAQSVTPQARVLAEARGIGVRVLDYDSLRGLESNVPTRSEADPPGLGRDVVRSGRRVDPRGTRTAFLESVNRVTVPRVSLVTPRKPALSHPAMLLRRRSGLVALGGVALLVAACGGGSTSSNGGESPTSTKASSSASSKTPLVGKPLTPQQASDTAIQLLGALKPVTGNTTRGVNGKVISIGGVADVKDASGLEDYLGVCDAAKARFARANREGGVNGYTINYVGCDDTGTNPDTTRTDTMDMVQNKKVFALVPKTAPSGAEGDFLAAQHVPYFGWGVDSDYCGWNDRQFGFSVTGPTGCPNILPHSGFFSSLGLDTYTKGTHKTAADVKWAFISSNDSQSVTAVNAFNSIATSEGSKVAYKTNSIPSQGQPPLSDYAPLAQQVVASGATAIYVITSPSALFALVPALRATGYKGDIIIPFADSRLLPLASTIDLAYAETTEFGTLVYPSKEFAQMTADLKAVGSKAPADGLGSVSSYIAADMFLKALAQVKGPLTTEALAQVINGGGFSYPSFGNVICGTTWPSAHVIPGNCSALVQFSAAKKAELPVADLQTSGEVYLFNE